MVQGVVQPAAGAGTATAVEATAEVANSNGMPQLNLTWHFVKLVSPSLLLAGAPGLSV